MSKLKSWLRSKETMHRELRRKNEEVVMLSAQIKAARAEISELKRQNSVGMSDMKTVTLKLIEARARINLREFENTALKYQNRELEKLMSSIGAAPNSTPAKGLEDLVADYREADSNYTRVWEKLMKLRDDGMVTDKAANIELRPLAEKLSKAKRRLFGDPDENCLVCYGMGIKTVDEHLKMCDCVPKQWAGRYCFEA